MLLALKTLGTLWRKRHHIIFVQNPSRVLAAVAALFKLVLRYPLIVDRHTNFRLGKGFSLNPAIWFVIICSEFSLRVADLTIVTNSYLKELVERKGGRAFILTDPIPEFPLAAEPRRNTDRFTVFYVCTFSHDEPYEEVIGAANLLDNSVTVQISGNYRKVGLTPTAMPDNVELTGFVSNQEYDELLVAADAVMALTSAEWCLVCGGYEAIGAAKPLITSATETLKDFYGEDATFTGHTQQEIAAAIEDVREQGMSLYERGLNIKKVRKESWARDFNELQAYVSALSGLSSATGS
ncbi:glycosyltransferase family protein [Halovibrio salipaludis]|nr:glycosyltransferase [Halovibrio salipaludis]